MHQLERYPIILVCLGQAGISDIHDNSSDI